MTTVKQTRTMPSASHEKTWPTSQFRPQMPRTTSARARTKTSLQAHGGRRFIASDRFSCGSGKHASAKRRISDLQVPHKLPIERKARADRLFLDDDGAPEAAAEAIARAATGVHEC
jgi:hypothetical protein